MGHCAPPTSPRINHSGGLRAKAPPPRTAPARDQPPTLRDVYAAAALTGYMSKENYSDESSENLAKWAFEVADVMLRARER